MSVQMCSKSTIGSLAETFSYLLEFPQNHVYDLEELQKAFKDCRRPPYGSYDKNLIAGKLFSMNKDSYEYRYKEFVTYELPSKLEGRNLELEKGKRYQFLKSLDCFLYQCSECHTEEFRALYDSLTRFFYYYSYLLITESEEYKKAEWA